MPHSINGCLFLVKYINRSSLSSSAYLNPLLDIRLSNCLSLSTIFGHYNPVLASQLTKIIALPNPRASHAALANPQSPFKHSFTPEVIIFSAAIAAATLVYIPIYLLWLCCYVINILVFNNCTTHYDTLRIPHVALSSVINDAQRRRHLVPI